MMNCLRQRIRQLGFISAGNFSRFVVKVPVRALAALIENLIPDKDHSNIEKNLWRQGVSGDDLASLVGLGAGCLG